MFKPFMFGSGGFNPAAYIAANALVRFNASSIVGNSGVTLTNVGTGGSAYDCATNVGTAANRRRHPSGSALLFGASGDFVSSATVSIPGSIDLRVKLAMADWTPATSATILGKWTTSGNQRSFDFNVSAAGALRLEISGTGAAGGGITIASSANPSVSDGDALWVRVTWDSTTKDTTFYTSPASDGVSWTQLGTVQTLNIAAIFDSTALIEVGSNTGGTQNRLSGCVYRAYVYSGATLVRDMDPAQWTTGTTFSSGGVTWTLNGNSFIQNTGVDCVTTIGSNALETAAGQTIASPATVFAVARFTNAAPGANQYLFEAKSSGTDRWILLSVESNSDKLGFYQGSDIRSLSQAYDTNLHVLTLQFLGSASSNLSVSGVGSVTGNAGTSSWDFATLFADAGGGGTWQGVLADFIVIPGSVPSAYVTAINAYLKALYGTV